MLEDIKREIFILQGELVRGIDFISGQPLSDAQINQRQKRHDALQSKINNKYPTCFKNVFK